MIVSIMINILFNILVLCIHNFKVNNKTRLNYELRVRFNIYGGNMKTKHSFQQC